MIALLLALVVASPGDFRFSPEFAELVFPKKQDFISSVLSVDRYGKFITLFPNGCDLSQANMQKLVDTGVLDWQRPIEDLKIPFTGVLVYPKKATIYYKDGFIHRDDGPAIIHDSGIQEWFQYNMLHRDGGPAVLRPDAEFYYKNGILHREDGPAVIYKDGTKYWFLEGRLQPKRRSS